MLNSVRSIRLIMQSSLFKKSLKTVAYGLGMLSVACTLSSCDSIVSLLSYLIELPIDIIDAVLP